MWVQVLLGVAVVITGSAVMVNRPPRGVLALGVIDIVLGAVVLVLAFAQPASAAVASPHWLSATVAFWL
jgi:hypothetical protein